MQNIVALARRIIALPWLPAVLSVAGFLAYFIRAIEIARTRTSFLDEGMYLFKGYLFATGAQTPFADYGVWTNHAILSFLIPGFIQKWFGPGLETGRYFMIFLSLLTLLGLWVFARRWGNMWWATGAVWAMALNPAEIKVHTLAISEGTIAAILVWIVALTVGKERPLWQVLLGAALTAPLVLTRENMAFVPPILFAYVFWQHGWKTGLLAMACSGILFLVGNAFYYPDNLKFWATRVPRAISPEFLREARVQRSGGTPIPEPEASNLYRMVLYFMLTFRLHFLSLVSALTAWLLLPFRFKPMNERMRAVTFLSVLLLVLFFAHVQAAFFGEFCISCILLYVGYFDFLGLMLLVIAVPLLLTEVSTLRRVVIFVVMAVLTVGIGFSTHEDLSPEFARRMIERLDGMYAWGVLVHYIDLPTLVLFRVTFVLLVSALVVLIGGIVLWGIQRQLRRVQSAGGRIGSVALSLFLIVGLLLSSTKVLGAGNDFFDCQGSDVFASYRDAGAELSQVIEPGSKVYWEGRLTAIFLYLPEVQFYAPQLNHVHSYFIGGEPDSLLRGGFWNDALAGQWLQEADYIMVQRSEMIYLTDDILESGEYVRIMAAPKAERCRWQSVITVYQRADAQD